MSKSSHNAKTDRECSENCKSIQHVYSAFSAITKRGIEDRQLASYLSSLCCNIGKIHINGTSTLHMAVSCGRHKLAQWLITVTKADINLRDAESGYTALHRSVFYGHLNTAVKLIKMGANQHQTDFEDLTPIGIVTRDRDPKAVISKSEPCQVYIWGQNNNYTIGTANARKHPELLNQFRKGFISITQVAMDEFHSVFVSSCGKVWSCGHGQGGRLGTGSEKPALTPLPVRMPVDATCLKADVAINHTLLLLSKGTVVSFGLNTHYQLGIVPYIKSCSQPRTIYMEPFKDKIEDVCAAKYHSVFHTENDLYTCGINAGQLGHPKTPNSTFIYIPTQVPLQLRGSKIKLIASSTGAIVIYTTRGDIFSIHQYQCRKIASKQLNIVKISVIGGSIDNKVIPDATNDELKIAALTSNGGVLLWEQNLQQLTRCVFGMRKHVSVSDIYLTQSHILFTTVEGEGFEGTIKSREKVPVRAEVENRVKSAFHVFLDWNDCYHINSKRLHNVHRAVAISSDPKGHNFSILQVHPGAALTSVPLMSPSEIPEQLQQLLEEASEDDLIHDVVFSVNNEVFPAHRYMLCLSNFYLGEVAQCVGTVFIDDVNSYIFKQLLLYIYTGDNEVLHPGPFQYRFLGSKDDPVKQMLEVSCRYKMQTLTKKLSSLRYINGNICLKEGFSLTSRVVPPLNRSLFPELYDIKLEATDGIIVEAHKCVLSARLEYFRHMLNGGWIESGSGKSLKLQFQSGVLNDVVDFLYTEEVPESLSTDDLGHTVRLVIAADQLFINNLKEACEIVLCNALTLKNAASLLQLALTYNTNQLKAAVMEFMSINLNAILESRILEGLSDDILDEFSNFHRANMTSKYSCRVITPYSEAPSDETILQAPTIPWPDDLDVLEPCTEVKKSKIVHNSTKKRSQQKSISSQSEVKIEFDSDPPIQILEISPPPSPEKIEKLWDPSQFPLLEPISNKKSTSPRMNSDSKRLLVPIPKLSQKQKKKVVAECEIKVESPPKLQFRGWGLIPGPPEVSIDNLRQPVSPVDIQNKKFTDIVASEKEQRNNWEKMKGKSFYLTQIEDKAMEELLIFYNAINAVDERIIIQRVLPTNVATPTWITSHRQLKHVYPDDIQVANKKFTAIVALRKNKQLDKNEKK